MISSLWRKWVILPLFPRKNKCLSKKDYQLLYSITKLCVDSIFDGDYRDWFLDDELRIHRTDSIELFLYGYLVRTTYRDAPLSHATDSFKAVHDRLSLNTVAFILSLKDKNQWRPTRMNIIAVCLVVAEVTEEITFMVNGKSKSADELLKKMVDYAYRDDGILHQLCQLHGTPD